MITKKDFLFWGTYLFESHLVHGSAGNMSALSGDGKILITRSGSFLSHLKEEDIISVEKEGDLPSNASVESIVHRQVYEEAPDTGCVIHTHPLYVVTYTIGNDDNYFTALDEEGILYFGGIVPMISARSGSPELAKKVAGVLAKSPAVIAKGHGIFTRGKTMAEAVNIVASVEHSAKIVYLKHNK